MEYGLPLYILILDYILGSIMWTLIGRTVLDLFISADSPMVIARVFRQLTDPLIRLFDRLTPKFLLPSFKPLYVAWFFFMVRFYVIPFIYIGEMGLLSFSLEGVFGDFIRSFYR